MVRFKHRYLLVHLLFPSLSPEDPTRPLHESDLIKVLRESLSVNFGDLGAGTVGGLFSIKYFSPTTRILIIRVAREHAQTLWCALTLLRRLGGETVIARVLHVSGTIRKTQLSAISYDRLLILESAGRLRRKGKTADADKIEAQVGKDEEQILGMEA
ncbi:BQ2448_302 [Microbotryum intermedium]|uniref:BQ2448_302 protein n=1 Tax=Microbotryum intermedium TaxID=269621 RepID=A0A238F7X0_9BASI|nr:BQ2448_302 [Microbotryum intermedium]